MDSFGPPALFYAIATIMALFAGFAMFRLPASPKVASEDKEKHIYIPRSSHVVIEMDYQREEPVEDSAGNTEPVE